MNKSDEVLAFIDRHISEKGYSPTVREIGAAIGLSSSSTVSGHLERLKKKGLIDYIARSPRSIRLTHSSVAVKEIKQRKGIPTVIEYQGRRYVYDPGR